MSGQEGREKNVFEIAPPLAFRTRVGLDLAHTQERNTSGFNIYGLDLLAAGVMHENVSFLLIYTPRVDEPAADFSGAGDGANPSQLGTLESANVVFSNIVHDHVGLRVGRLEPAYHAFSSKRSYYALQPYEIYGFGTPAGGFSFEDNQMGLEATGRLRRGCRYGVGVVNGSGASPDNNKAKDVYLRLSHVLGRGEGQSAGQRLGFFGYRGWQPTTVADSTPSPLGEADGRGNESFYRVGGDLSLNWSTFNLQALYLYGKDNKTFNWRVPTQDYKYSGGFVQLDYAGLMDNRLLASALYNWVQPPSSDAPREVRAFAALLRYYLGDWTAVNVALHAEYAHRQVGKKSPQKEDLVTLLVDFAF